MAQANSILRLILGDQLNANHSWFKTVNPKVIYCFFESQSELDYAPHHIQKVIGIFMAMRNFAAQLKKQGHQVTYFAINNPKNQHDFSTNIKQLIAAFKITRFEYLEPDEYRIDSQLKALCAAINIKTKCLSTEHFYTTREELQTFFKGKKTYLMESFYRMMRKKHQILMMGNNPVGGQWNFDKNNRNKWTPKDPQPQALCFKNDYTKVQQDLEQVNYQTIGELEPNFFTYPINYKQAKALLDFFCKTLLCHFGTYQDAMHTSHKFLFHSKLSFALNLKIISPKEVIETVLDHAVKHPEIHIAQTEGFVRQILGWREYMRGMYWAVMPQYKSENQLNNTRPLPKFFWTGQTKMNCLKHSITQSLENSYAHHIQRLMITGNFALLTQCHPDAVDQWYLGIYLDAIEWVQLPNTRGMSQYADGGKIATKPYISSGAYINKMSDYCKDCCYKVKEKTTADACPFNALYWNFLDDKKEQLSGNRRMSMMYALWHKMSPEEHYQIKQKAQHIIENTNAY